MIVLHHNHPSNLMRKRLSSFKQNVPVIAAFENTASVIQQMRQFEYRHGGIVNSHDILGQRLGKNLNMIFLVKLVCDVIS